MADNDRAGDAENLWYEQVFDSIDEGFCVVKVIFEGDKPVDYRFIKTNPQFERQTGLVDAVGRTARELVPGLEQHWIDTYGRVVTTGQSLRFEDWSEAMGRWFDVYASRVGESANHMVVVVFTDVTQRKRNEHAIRESEERFRTLADNAPMMICEVGSNAEVTFWNRTWLEFTGRSFDEALGRDWAEFVHPDDYGRLQATYAKSFEQRQSYVIDVRIADRDDDYHWIEFHGNPAYHADGSFAGMIAMGLDVTERKHLERQKDDFIGIASHELKTPLTSIKAYTQILERRFKRTGDDKSTDSMVRINAQVDRLNGLVGDLLDITKVETGKLKLHIAEFDFDASVAEAVETVQLTADRHSIAIHGATEQMIWSDRDRTQQVLINLLNNAIKYSPNARDIEVRLSEADNRVRLCVQDHGVGIPADKQTAVFQRFYRVSGPTMESFPGLGLGLYISSELVGRLGGRIWVESVEGEGSTFCIELPIDRRRAPRDPHKERRRNQAAIAQDESRRG